MADSTISDISKMKVVELRKELRARGLPYSGDKAELIARLQAATQPDEHADINLDSDELDSEGVLDDEDEKAHHDILEDSAVDTLTEELALEESSPEKTSVDAKPQKILKRKITTEIQKEQSMESKDIGPKKIVLNRTISMTSSTTATQPTEKEEEEADKSTLMETNKVKITTNLDLKTRLEMRAKRFGLPVQVSDDIRKEARKQRFGTTNISSNVSNVTIPGTLTDNLDKLKKRAERFGQSVSSLMTDIEKQEKLAKRKAKFGAVK
ncbi:SAP domain-containing ribonucleoprotein [Pieris rapae]|uniref:SAP domain-containing ribonucleoprotein n=1 Tax=Pieris rapae TaxID=64459 RepID=UPI001E27A689|nr:SAP domain-containing ribonucleoprotein [Pieris rapae]